MEQTGVKGKNMMERERTKGNGRQMNIKKRLRKIERKTKGISGEMPRG